MLNPKIVEVYGEESRNAFYELINEMGKDLASTCYVITRCPMIVDGAHMPSAMSSAADNPIAVRKAISTFMSRHRASDDLEDLDTICVAERGPREGELKLWL